MIEIIEVERRLGEVEGVVEREQGHLEGLLAALITINNNTGVQPRVIGIIKLKGVG